MMDFLAIPFGWVLKICYNLTAIFGGDGNYVFALMFFAIVMQLLLSPFGIIQQRNQVKQAKMRPMEYIIRKKYAGRNDRATQQKMQQEIMELYQKEGYSPLKGCLPMLLQLVIIFPLYQVVIKPLQFISGLSAGVCATLAQCFNSFDANLALDTKKSGWQVRLATEILEHKAEWASIVKEIPGAEGAEAVVSADAAKAALEALQGVKFFPNAAVFGSQPFDAFGNFKGLWFLFFIPIINLGLMYLSQFITKKLNPQQMQDPTAAANPMGGSMKIMMWTMPLMTFFFTFTFPAAIGVYWIFRTILSVLQQLILSKIFKMPKFTDEDLKQIEKEMREAKKGSYRPNDIVYESGAQRPYKSLHHIDDEE